MSFLFKTKKQKYKTVAIFDIGSGSIGGAIVKIPTKFSSSPIILSSVRTDIPSKDNESFDDFMNSMLRSLDITSHKLLYEKSGGPEEIFYVLASPWYISETRTIKLNRVIPFIFKKNIADKLISKELSSLNNSYKERYGDNGTPDVIENHIISVSLDNNIIENPIGKKCISVQMNMIASLSPSTCINGIKSVISKNFHDTKVSFSSFPLSSYLAIRDKYINSDSYLFVDIGGEITDIGIVSNGVLSSITSFPFGRKTFYEYLCDKLNIEQREAREIISLYNDGNLIDKHNKKILNIINQVEVLWLKSFRESINLLGSDINIPKDIFLTIDDDIKKIFIGILDDFKVETLNGRDFLDMCNVYSGSCDPFLMIESISVTKKLLCRYNK